MVTEFKSNHAQVCEAWKLMEASQRVAHLEAAQDKLALLTGDARKAKRLFAYLLEQAPHVSHEVRLLGATGESNDLYNSARGKTMVVGTESAKTLPVLGQLMAALLTGNEVILHYPSQQEMCLEAVDALYKAGVPEDVVSIANDSQTEVLLHMNRLAQVAMVGSAQEVQAISNELATSEGILTQVIAVTDLEGCHEMFDPEYLHRFVTERVRTINTTAIGGNASLLELGVE